MSNRTTPNNVSMSRHKAAESSKLVAATGATAGQYEIQADFAVWDNVNNKYLFPGRDYNPGDLQRS
jgi:hypothetical protein